MRLFRHVFRGAAYVLAGVAVALLLLRAIAKSSDIASVGVIVMLFAGAVLLFALAVLLGVGGETLEARIEQREAAAHDGLSAEEWEEERRRETPRLAREFGKAQRAPSDEDPPLGW